MALVIVNRNPVKRRSARRRVKPLAKRKTRVSRSKSVAYTVELGQAEKPYIKYWDGKYFTADSAKAHKFPTRAAALNKAKELFKSADGLYLRVVMVSK